MNDNKPIGNNDWLKDFDLEDKVLCDSYGCENDALFYTRTGCCNTIILACAPCMIKAGKIAQVMIMRQQVIDCNACGQLVSPKKWLSMPSRLALDTTPGL